MRRLFDQERRFPPHFSSIARQVDLNEHMRSILVDWLVEVHTEFNMKRETLFLAVRLLDRYLQLCPGVQRGRLQLVGITSLLIAAKYEEIHPMEVRAAVDITDCAYTAQDVLQMECMILRALEFEVACPTVLHFMEPLQAVNRVQQHFPFVANPAEKTGCGAGELCDQLAWYLAELALMDAKMCRFLPSQVAAAAVLVSNRLLGRVPAWPLALEEVMGLPEKAIATCARELDRLRRQAASSDLQQIPRKFAAIAKLGKCMAAPG